MTALPSQKLTVDEFLVWAEGQNRLELHDGIVVQLAAERVGHARVKFSVQRALEDGVKTAKLDCVVFPDGVSVRIADDVCYEPDALVYCGPPLPADALEVPNPVIIVEVLSPSTQHIDIGRKLTGYMTLPSVVHYLIIDPLRPPLVHHQRMADGTILTHLVRGGTLRLEPPGIEIDLAPVFTNS